MRLNDLRKTCGFYGLRVFSFMLLFRTLILQTLATEDKRISFHDFLSRGLLSFSVHDGNGNYYFDFTKLLLLLSLYFVGYLGSIVFLHDLSDGYAGLLKSHSNSRRRYLYYRIKLTIRPFILDTVVWISGAILITFYGVGLDLSLLLKLFLGNLLLYLNISLLAAYPSQTLVLVFIAFFLQNLLLKGLGNILAGFLIIMFILGWTQLGALIRKEE